MGGMIIIEDPTDSVRSAAHSKSFLSLKLRARYSDGFPTYFAVLAFWRICRIADDDSRQLIHV